MPHVDVLVADEMLSAVPELLRLLEAQEVSRKPDSAPATTRLTIEMAYVPEGAVAVNPAFQRIDDEVSVQSLAWTYA